MNHSIYRVPGYVAEDRVAEVQEAVAKAVSKNQQEERAAHPKYKEPNNVETWWVNVDEWWPELLAIVQKYVKLDKPAEENGLLLGFDGHIHMAQLKQDRDPKLAEYFDQAWCNAPDAGWIHSHPGWGVLCDLCSEQWVFNPIEGEVG